MANIKPVRVGTILYGYVSKFRDSGPFRVEAIGADWIVARKMSSVESCEGLFFYSSPPEDFEEYTDPALKERY